MTLDKGGDHMLYGQLLMRPEKQYDASVQFMHWLFCTPEYPGVQ
jgi:hypothetical protein